MMSLEDIRRKIVELKEKPELKHQLPMAMCYSMIMPTPEDFEYICPKCGEKTLYKKTPFNQIGELLKSRRLIYALKNRIAYFVINDIFEQQMLPKYPQMQNDMKKKVSTNVKHNGQKALDIELIELDYCLCCSKETKGDPKLGIMIKYEDKNVSRYPISYKDIEIIHEFIVGNLIVSYGFGREKRSMHSHLPRIEYLLGLID